MLACTPIGIARTPFETQSDAPRQGLLADVVGEIVVAPEYERGLAGLEAGRDVDVVWYADRADRHVLEITNGSRRGVFASRSQDRPNPICITRCRLLDVDGRRLEVQGVDMLDGTPVLDLKAPLRQDRSNHDC